MLYPVIKDVAGIIYCGPTAIAAITGYPISAVYEVIRKTQTGNKKSIQGLSVLVATTCIMKLNYSVVERRSCDETVLNFMCIKKDGPYLLAVESPPHFAAVSEETIVDTNNSFPLPWEDWPARHLYTKVSGWIKFKRRD